MPMRAEIRATKGVLLANWCVLWGWVLREYLDQDCRDRKRSGGLYD